MFASQMKSNKDETSDEEERMSSEADEESTNENELIHLVSEEDEVLKNNTSIIK